MTKWRPATFLLGVLLIACSPAAKEVVAGFRPLKAPPGQAAPTLHAAPALPVTPTIAPSPEPVATMPAPTREWPQPGMYGVPSPAATPIPSPVPAIVFNPDDVNVVLIGADLSTTDGFRTDVIIIASIRPGTGDVVLVSVPRDLYVYLPGYTMQRINTAWIYGEKYGYPGGGFGMLRDTILYNLGIPIQNYVRVDMSGFRREINNLGGIDVLVACPYTDWRLRSPSAPVEDEESWVLFTAPSGKIHMNGDYALWYARSRARSSDFDRARRQHEVLRAIFRQALRLEMIPRMPELYGDLTEILAMDLSLGELVSLAPMATQLEPSRIRSRFIGRDQVIAWRIPSSGAQVLVPRPAEIESLLTEAYAAPVLDPLVPAPPEITIQIVNQSRHPDWDLLAAERLNYAGFLTAIADDEPQSGSVSQVIELDQSADAAGQRVLQAVGLSGQQLITAPDSLSPFQFRLVIGSNYRPCFNPTEGQ